MRFRALAPLRHGPYARVWTGAFVSNIGTWMETVAIGIYVTESTGRATWTGLVAAAGFVPTALLGPVGGALADRMERKLLLIGTNAVQMVLSAILTVLFLTGDPAPGIVTLIVLAGGCANALGFPAFQAMLPDLVPVEELPGAIGLSSAQWNLGRVIGPAIAGLVIGSSQRYSMALAINAVSFLAVIAVLITLRLPRPDPRMAERSLFGAIGDGVRFVRADAGLRTMVMGMCLAVFLAAPFIALVPAMAIEVLHEGAKGTAVLVTAQGIGAVIMGLAVGPLAARFGVKRVMVACMSALPLALVLYASAPNLAWSALTLMTVGLFYLGTLSSFTTTGQQRSPSYLRGRVFGVNTVILGTFYPLGSLIQGALADVWGLRAVTAGAGITMGVVLVATRVVRPHIADGLDAPLMTPVDPLAVAD